MQDFCHLHVHSNYSVLDGTNKIPALVARVKELGMSACAITDHGNLHGIVEFQKEAEKVGIKPVLGCEAYITEDEDGIENNADKTNDNHHMVILAQNNQGLRNLSWLISNANLRNFYRKPRISMKNLEQRADGLIATSACLGGVVIKRATWLPEEEKIVDLEGEATSRARKLSSIFQGRFYLEIQDNDMWEQNAANHLLINMAKSEGLPLVITADAHYLQHEDATTHELIMAQQQKKTLEEYREGDAMKYGRGYYIRSPKEMFEAAKKWGAEEAFWNTIEIAEMCTTKIELGQRHMPVFDPSKETDYQDFLAWRASRG